MSCIRCRKCRNILFQNNCIVDIHGITMRSNLYQACCVEKEKTQIYISLDEDVIPLFISQAIEESSWTKGRLTCPKCHGRIGSFDFLSSLQCLCGEVISSPVHILRSRIDYFTGSAVLSTMKSAGMVSSETASNTFSKGQRLHSSNNKGIKNSKKAIIVEKNNKTTNEDNRNVSPLDLTLETSDFINTQGGEDVRSTLSSDLIQESSVSAPFVDSQCISHIDRNDGNPRVRKRRQSRRARDQETSNETTLHMNSVNCRKNRYSGLPVEEDVTREEEESVNYPVPEELCCPVCLDMYCQPVICQPCQHTFCDPCLRRLARERPLWTPCPLCRVHIKKCVRDNELRFQLKSTYGIQYTERVQKERQFSNDKFYALPYYIGSPTQFVITNDAVRIRQSRTKKACITVACLVFGILICFAFPMLSNASKILDAALTLITLIDVIGFVF